MRALGIGSAAFAGLLIVASGCGGKTADAVDVQSFCGEIAKAVSGGISTCCPGLPPEFFTEESSVRQMRETCAFDVIRPYDVNAEDIDPDRYDGDILAALDDDGEHVARLDFDERAAAGALNEIRGAVDGCTQFAPVTTARIYERSERGGPCDITAHCATPYTCAGAIEGELPGECVDPPARGEACVDRCGDGSVCSSAVCGDRLPEGAACREDTCASGLVCSGSGRLAKCIKQVDDGELSDSYWCSPRWYEVDR